MTNSITEAQVREVLKGVAHPILEDDLVALDMVRDIAIQDGEVSLRLALLSPANSFQQQIKDEVEQSLKDVDGVGTVKVELDTEVPYDGRKREGSAVGVRNVVAVASGKGGVGKSTVAVNIAVALAQSGARVGLLDTDVYGPNVPRMIGVDRLPAPPADDGRLQPAEAYDVKLMSIGFLVKPEQAMVWRGPMLHNAIRQFVEDVEWGELDFLIVDMPPGTGDVQLSLAQTTPLSGGVIVTLPQEVSVDDARRGMEMFRQMRIPLFGVVENMSFLELPTGEKVEVFGSGGGQALADEMQVPFIGQIPMDPSVREGGDSGKPVVIEHPDSSAAKALRRVAEDIALKTAIAARENQSQAVPITMVDE